MVDGEEIQIGAKMDPFTIITENYVNLNHRAQRKFVILSPRESGLTQG